jgi:uncharacterized protein YqeY
MKNEDDLTDDERNAIRVATAFVDQLESLSAQHDYTLRTFATVVLTETDEESKVDNIEAAIVALRSIQSVIENIATGLGADLDNAHIYEVREQMLKETEDVPDEVLGEFLKHIENGGLIPGSEYN